MKSEAEHVVINALTSGRSDRGCFGDYNRLFLKIGYNHQNTETWKTVIAPYMPQTE